MEVAVHEATTFPVEGVVRAHHEAIGKWVRRADFDEHRVVVFQEACLRRCELDQEMRRERGARWPPCAPCAAWNGETLARPIKAKAIAGRTRARSSTSSRCPIGASSPIAGVQSYHKLRREQEFLDRKRDPLLQSEEQRKP